MDKRSLLLGVVLGAICTTGFMTLSLSAQTNQPPANPCRCATPAPSASPYVTVLPNNNFVVYNPSNGRYRVHRSNDTGEYELR